MENTAIIIVDLQEYFKEHFYQEEIKEVLKNHEKLIEYAAENQMPIYNFRSQAFGKTIPELSKYLKQSKNVKNWSKNPGADNCFTKPKLLESLVKDGTDNLIITGISTPYCVYGTGLAGSLKGFNIISSLDLIAAQRDESSNTKFQDWLYSNGELYDSIEELIEEAKYEAAA